MTVCETDSPHLSDMFGCTRFVNACPSQLRGVRSIRRAKRLPFRDTDGDRTFLSLCCIVAGQQLAGAAAHKMFCRLLHAVGATEEDTSNFSPDRILWIKEGGNVKAELRAPAGLSNAK